MKIFLGGINSSGKTSLLNALKAMCPSISICHGSMAFMEWLGIEQGDYKSLIELPEEYKNKELGLMINSLMREAEKGKKPWIFCGHFCGIKGRNVYHAVGDWISEFNLMVLLTAEPEIIRDRVKKDYIAGTRERGDVIEFMRSSSNSEVEKIALFSKQTELVAHELSLTHGLPLLKLDSSNQPPRQLAYQLINSIRLNG